MIGSLKGGVFPGLSFFPSACNILQVTHTLSLTHTHTYTGATQESLVQALGKDVVKIGMGPLMKTKQIKKDGDKVCVCVCVWVCVCVFYSIVASFFLKSQTSISLKYTHTQTQLVRLVESLVDETQAHLQAIKASEGVSGSVSEDVVKTLRKRQLVAQVYVCVCVCVCMCVNVSRHI